MGGGEQAVQGGGSVNGVNGVNGISSTLASYNFGFGGLHPEVQKRKDAARYEAGIRAQQARADEQEAARKKRREKEMYLALALGGAKTMAGQSQFALSNVGEGLGAGVGAIAAYDQNEMERVAASQAATTKARAELAAQLNADELAYSELRLKVTKEEDFLDFVKQVEQALEDGEIAPPKDGSMTGKEVARAKIEDFITRRIQMINPRRREYRDSKDQIFYAAE